MAKTLKGRICDLFRYECLSRRFQACSFIMGSFRRFASEFYKDTETDLRGVSISGCHSYLLLPLRVVQPERFLQMLFPLLLIGL